MEAWAFYSCRFVNYLSIMGSPVAAADDRSLTGDYCYSFTGILPFTDLREFREPRGTPRVNRHELIRLYSLLFAKTVL